MTAGEASEHKIPLPWRGARRAGWLVVFARSEAFRVSHENYPVRLRRPPLQRRGIVCPDASSVVIARAEGPRQSIRTSGLLRRIGRRPYGLPCRSAPRNDGLGELAGDGGFGWARRVPGDVPSPASFSRKRGRGWPKAGRRCRSSRRKAPQDLNTLSPDPSPASGRGEMEISPPAPAFSGIETKKFGNRGK
jgi:hypothetical protein